MNINELYNIYSQYYLVCTDTRNLIKNSIFFALKGGNFNGNLYAEQAINNGCIAAIVDEKEYENPKKNIYYFNNGLATLQLLAKHHRNQLIKTTFIGLTGSNGKTTTKELIYAVLSSKYKTAATKGNLNNHIGVPLTLLSIVPETEFAIIEMGANHQQEIAFLSSLAQPDLGYITNFGKAHLEGFRGFEGVIKGKTELYNYLKNNNKKVFINQNDPIQILKSLTLDKISIGEKGTDIQVGFVKDEPYVCVRYKNTEIESNLIGNYNFNNIAVAVAIGIYFDLEIGAIKKAIENYVPTNNRSQILEQNGKQIVLDAYNANPTSMEAALHNFSKYENSLVILGDMFEVGETVAKEHLNIAQKANELIKGKIYLVGSEFEQIDLKSKKIKTFKNRTLLEDYLKENSTIQKYILVKGSRGMALEKVVPLIE